MPVCCCCLHYKWWNGRCAIQLAVQWRQEHIFSVILYLTGNFFTMLRHIFNCVTNLFQIITLKVYSITCVMWLCDSHSKKQLSIRMFDLPGCKIFGPSDVRTFVVSLIVSIRNTTPMFFFNAHSRTYIILCRFNLFIYCFRRTACYKAPYTLLKLMLLCND